MKRNIEIYEGLVKKISLGMTSREAYEIDDDVIFDETTDGVDGILEKYVGQKVRLTVEVILEHNNECG